MQVQGDREMTVRVFVSAATLGGLRKKSFENPKQNSPPVPGGHGGLGANPSAAEENLQL